MAPQNLSRSCDATVVTPFPSETPGRFPYDIPEKLSLLFNDPLLPAMVYPSNVSFDVDYLVPSCTNHTCHLLDTGSATLIRGRGRSACRIFKNLSMLEGANRKSGILEQRRCVDCLPSMVKTARQNRGGRNAASFSKKDKIGLLSNKATPAHQSHGSGLVEGKEK
eukprot:scaffold34656_cov178-Amphora_coffeaeformis.AAC.2